MVVQILSGIHLEKLFFSFKEKLSLTGFWTQNPLKKFYKAPALPSELSHFSLIWKNHNVSYSSCQTWLKIIIYYLIIFMLLFCCFCCFLEVVGNVSFSRFLFWRPFFVEYSVLLYETTLTHKNFVSAVFYIDSSTTITLAFLPWFRLLADKWLYDKPRLGLKNIGIMKFEG